MKNHFLFLITLMFCSLLSNGQNISVSFTAAGGASTIDRAKATNLSINQSITLPCSDTLVLSVTTRIPTVSELTHLGMVFPNPFQGRTTITFTVQKPQTVYFTKGDVIHYTFHSGRFVTILTDSPKASKNCEVEFVACEDPDGKNYSVILIGEQTWMAENLAYLPVINGTWAGSRIQPYYYVMGYEGTNVNTAKASSYYTDYHGFSR